MIAFGGALLVALVATPCVVWLAHRWQLIDVPNHRSSHATPVPRGGGIAVALAAVVGVAVGGTWTRAVGTLVVAALLLGLVGLLDDRFGLPPLPRLLVQVMTPGVAAAVVAEQSGLRLVLTLAVAVVACAGYVNAFNFMDGINGISGCQAAIAGGWIAIVSGDLGGVHPVQVVGLAIAGAAVGFLPYNVPRAQIFLGDVGSYFVGFWLAAAALLVTDAGASPAVVVAPFTLYLLDTASVLVRRARRGARLMQAHREHAYQRLVLCGLSHASVAAIVAVGSIACCAIMYAALDSPAGVQLLAFACCLLIAVAYLLLPGRIESRAPRPTAVRP